MSTWQRCVVRLGTCSYKVPSCYVTNRCLSDFCEINVGCYLNNLPRRQSVIGNLSPSLNRPGTSRILLGIVRLLLCNLQRYQCSQVSLASVTHVTSNGESFWLAQWLSGVSSPVRDEIPFSFSPVVSARCPSIFRSTKRSGIIVSGK